ncbi:ORM1-like protein 2 isoform X1 [Phoenix dactylifera]|uniref:ORM1-like protein 2 isoform X1 n=1 Tax=Phoenix dactylifera TaxID=42345 RepID=A0A8B7MU30_PHODC|nr:ORM1-like protein 2 isoform X1 [Phoenix dactylifera]
MLKLYVEAPPPPVLNRNTEWVMYPGVWTAYVLLIFFAWIAVLSLLRCSPGVAWTVVNLAHFFVTYHCFHWRKGTPFAEDQGIYNGLTWWEQMDNGKQLTNNRKFLATVPVILMLCVRSHLRKVNLRLKDIGDYQVPDCLAHDGLPASDALPQYSCCVCAGGCQVP